MTLLIILSYLPFSVSETLAKLCDFPSANKIHRNTNMACTIATYNILQANKLLLRFPFFCLTIFLKYNTHAMWHNKIKCNIILYSFWILDALLEISSIHNLCQKGVEYTYVFLFCNYCYLQHQFPRILREDLEPGQYFFCSTFVAYVPNKFTI